MHSDAIKFPSGTAETVLPTTISLCWRSKIKPYKDTAKNNQV